MAASKKTDRIGLCLWESQDKPKRVDFCSDNTILETVISSHLEDAQSHLSVEDRKLLQVKTFEILTYTGTGASSRLVSLPFSPRLVIVFAQKRAFAVSRTNETDVYAAIATASGASSGALIMGKSLRVYSTAQSANGEKQRLNDMDEAYTIIAFE